MRKGPKTGDRRASRKRAERARPVKTPHCARELSKVGILQRGGEREVLSGSFRQKRCYRRTDPRRRRMAGYNHFRCNCDQCAYMRNQEEQNCCHSYPDLVEYMNEFDVDCITDHPGFQHVVLNPYVVETAYYSYRKTEYMWGRLSIRERSNYGMYRYAAYRQFVRMCWGIVGEDNRIILPACVYTAIRDTFYPGYSNILNYY